MSTPSAPKPYDLGVCAWEPFCCRFEHSKLALRLRRSPGALKLTVVFRTSAAHERAKRAQCAKRRDSVKILGDCRGFLVFVFYLFLFVRICICSDIMGFSGSLRCYLFLVASRMYGFSAQHF